MATSDVHLRAIGETVTRHRTAAGRTQQQLADAAGVARQSVIRVEGGQGTSLATLIRIADVLDLHLSVQ